MKVEGRVCAFKGAEVYWSDSQFAVLMATEVVYKWEYIFTDSHNCNSMSNTNKVMHIIVYTFGQQQAKVKAQN